MCGVPRVNQDFCLFAMGRSGGTSCFFNDRAERYHSCNLVTERDVTGELALLGGECA